MSKDKVDKLESLRGALVEGEESRMVKCSLDDILRELSVELGWIELRLD